MSNNIISLGHYLKLPTETLKDKIRTSPCVHIYMIVSYFIILIINEFFQWYSLGQIYWCTHLLIRENTSLTIVLASRVSERHLDTQILKKSPFRTPKRFCRAYIIEFISPQYNYYGIVYGYYALISLNKYMFMIVI